MAKFNCHCLRFEYFAFLISFLLFLLVLVTVSHCFDRNQDNISRFLTAPCTCGASGFPLLLNSPVCVCTSGLLQVPVLSVLPAEDAC